MTPRTVRLLLAAALIYVLPSVSSAQTCPSVQPSPAFVCVGGGWLPPGHPGIPAATIALPPAPVPSADGFVPSAATCDPRPNPYAEPAKAAACSAWDFEQRQRPALPSFDVGATYVHPYSAIRMVVLGIGSTLEGVPVVTAQYTAGPDLVGQVFAFRVDQGQPWTKQP